MNNLLIIKIGGNIIDDEVLLNDFLLKISTIQQPIILIHGGGKLATSLANDLQIPQQMIEGRRITDINTLKVVTMVYAGYINKLIVAKLQANNSNAFGLCGVDGNLITATKRKHPTVDYGFVGDVANNGVNTNLLKNLLQQNLLPVIAPITHNKEGQLLNTNADTIANQIAIQLSPFFNTTLIYCFDKKGVLSNINDENSIIKEITNLNADELKQQGVINAGMIPKIDNALNAVNQGVKNVVLGHANSILQLVNNTEGTLIKANL